MSDAFHYFSPAILCLTRGLELRAWFFNSHLTLHQSSIHLLPFFYNLSGQLRKKEMKEK
jgi:hypothetical protein